MTSPIWRRLVDLERRSRRGTASYVVYVEDDESSDDDAIAARIAEHRERTAWQGGVIISPRPAETIEEWSRRFVSKADDK